MNSEGTLIKMPVTMANPVRYQLVIGKKDFLLNDLLGKKIMLRYTGQIFCIQCGRHINKSFQQGYCFPCLRRLQECDLCILHPERCHVAQGTCPKDDWAHVQCYQQHIVYLANSSALKVGITRYTHVPTRWVDQGATQALPIFNVANRYQAGIMEVALKKFVADKTDWRRMLKQDAAPIDLFQLRDELFVNAEKEIAQVIATFQTSDITPIVDATPLEITYPVLEYPEKVLSLSFDKTPEISGILQGIKGQYLILDTGVLNVRKFAGYDVEFEGLV